MSDEWAVPAGMTPQDNPGQPKDGIGALVQRFRAFQVEMRDRFNLLKQAGIHVEPDLVRFTGAVRVEGTLDLPAGIIGNDALTSPVIFSGTWGHAENFAIPTSYAEIVRAEFTIPAGMTQMKFEVIATAQLGNTAGSAQYIYVRPVRWTNGVMTNFGTRQSKLFAAAGWDSMIAPYLYTDAVTPGDVIAFTLETYAGTTALAAHASNGTNIEVSITLTR